MKKSKETGKSKKKENSKELLDPKVVIKKNNYSSPKRGIFNQFIPEEQDYKIVYSYAAYGATNEDIAAILGIDNKTVTKYFEEELRSGRATAKNTIANRLYNIAIGKDAVINELGEVIAPAIKPNLSALIFLAKTRLGWKETQIIEQNVEMTTGVKIYLPDNGMKCEGEGDAE